MFGQDNSTPKKKAAWAKVKASHGIENTSGKFLTQGEMDTISNTVYFMAEEIARLKKLMETVYKEYDETKMSWEEFKKRNNI